MSVLSGTFSKTIGTDCGLYMQIGIVLWGSLSNSNSAERQRISFSDIHEFNGMPVHSLSSTDDQMASTPRSVV